jgi:hypothetical protein
MRLLFSLTLFCLMGSAALAGTSASFAKDDKSATIVVDNSKTADADFMWDLLVTPVDQTSKVFVRKAMSPNGLLTIECQRDTRVVGRTTCLLEFVADDKFVVIGREEKIASLTMMEDWGERFLKQFTPQVDSPFFISPDESLIFCWGCNGGLAEFTWSPK